MRKVLYISRELVFVSQVWFEAFLVQIPLFLLLGFGELGLIFIDGVFVLPHQNFNALRLVVVFHESLGFRLFDHGVVPFRLLRIKCLGRRGRRPRQALRTSSRLLFLFVHNREALLQISGVLFEVWINLEK